MTVKAKLADGRVLQFPDGTAPEVVQKAVKNVLSGAIKLPPSAAATASVPSAMAATPAVPAPTESRLRSYGEAAAQAVGTGAAQFPKAIPEAKAAGVLRTLTAYDQIDRGEEPHDNGLINRVDLGVYANADAPTRAAMRARLEQQDIDPRQSALYKAGQAIEEKTQKLFPTDPAYANEWGQKAVSGIASTIPFAVGALTARRLGIPGTAAVAGMGIASTTDQVFQDAIKSGASLSTALKAATSLTTVAAGASEAIPIGHWMDRLDKVSGGAFKKWIVNTVVQGTEEELQNGFQNWLTDAQAKGLYDPKRDELAGVKDQFGVGFTAGAALQLLTNMLPGKQRVVAQPGADAHPAETVIGATPNEVQPMPQPAGSAEPAAMPAVPRVEHAVVAPVAQADRPGEAVQSVPPAGTRAELEALLAGKKAAPPSLPEGAASVVPPAAAIVPPEAPLRPTPVAAQAEPLPLGNAGNTPKPVLDILKGRMTGDLSPAEIAQIAAALNLPYGKTSIDRALDQLGYTPERVQPGPAASFVPSNDVAKSDMAVAVPIRSPEATPIRSPEMTLESPQNAPPPGSPMVDEYRNRTDQGDGTKAAPIKLTDEQAVNAAAHVTNPEPTPAQIEAGNAAKRHLTWFGKQISIETEQGGIRRSKPGTPPWEAKMPAPYGQFLGVKGNDGDLMDVTVGPKPQIPFAFVIDQYNPDGTFDEHKPFVGVKTADEATELYDRSFSDGSGPSRRRGVTRMPAKDFKVWLATGDKRVPVAEPKIPEQTAPAPVDEPATTETPPAVPRLESPEQPAAAAPAPRRRSNQPPPDLFQFIRENGGMQDNNGELAATIGGKNDKRYRDLYNPNGLSDDHMRERAEEAGYLGVQNKDELFTRGPNDLYAAIDRQARGQPVHSINDLAEVQAIDARRQAREEQARDREAVADAHSIAQQHGGKLTNKEAKAAAILMRSKGLSAEEAVAEVLDGNSLAWEADNAHVLKKEPTRVRHQPPFAPAADLETAPAAHPQAEADRARAGPVVGVPPGGPATREQPGGLATDQGAAQAAQPAAEAVAPQPQEPPLFQAAYHGSPHDFEKFELSPRTALTGEGAHAYGYGLYFAGKKEIAEHYKRKLSQDVVRITVDGKTYARAETNDAAYGQRLVEHLAERLYKVKEDSENYVDYRQFEKGVDDVVFSVLDGKPFDKVAKENVDEWEVTDRYKDGYRAAVEALKGAKIEIKKGRLYHVDLPEDHELLAWDKPLSEQSAYVEAAIAKIPADVWRAAKLDPDPRAEYTGRELYQGLAEALGPTEHIFVGRIGSTQPRQKADDRAASNYLRSIGIPGHYFADAGSRGMRVLSPKESSSGKWVVGLGTANHKTFDTEAAAHAYLKEHQSFNYVIYDDSRIKTLAKYQIAHDVAGTANIGTAAQREAVKRRIETLVKQVIGDAGIRVNVADRLWGGGREVHGSYTPGERLIAIALNSPAGMGTPRHEVIHAMRDLGLIPERVWKTVAAEAEARWIDQHHIERDYPKLPREKQIEEAVAQAFGVFRSGRPEGLSGLARHTFARLRALLDRIKAAIGHALGLTPKTLEQHAKDILRDIEAGVYRTRSQKDQKGQKVGLEMAPAYQQARTYGWNAAHLAEHLSTEELVALRKSVEDDPKSQNPTLNTGQHRTIHRFTPAAERKLSAIDYAITFKLGDKRKAAETAALKTEKTPQGEQQVIPGAERITDRALIERKNEQPKTAKKPQVDVADLPLFDTNGPKQGSLFQIANGAPDTEMRERNMQSWLSKGQPIDRTLRMPFDWFGGIDEKGQWKPGAQFTKAAGRIIGTAKFSPEGRMAWANPLMETARAGLIDRYGLSDEYVSRDRQRALDERRVMVQGVEILKTLKDHAVGIEEAKVLQAILTGETVGPADMQALSGPIRQAVDDLGAEAVSLGLVSADSFERNRGTYLHRLYMKNEDDATRLSKWVSQFMGRKRRKIIGDQLKGRGIFLDVEMPRLMRDAPGFQEGMIGPAIKGQNVLVLDRLPEQDDLQLDEHPRREPRIVDRVFWPADRPIPPRYQDYTSRGTWEVRNVAGRKATLWRDYTKPERERMGEITDARYTIAKTFMLMGHDLATGRFYKDIATNEEWTVSAEPSGRWIEAADFNRYWNDSTVKWVKVPDTTIADTGGKKRYGALAGKFVRAEIWRDLNELQIMNRPNMWRVLLTNWKLNKTARSPVVHMNNVMSNFLLMDMADVRVQDLVAGITSYARGDPDFQDAANHGVFGADMMSAEIRKTVLEPVLRELQQQAVGGQAILLNRFGALGKLAERLWDGVKAIDGKMIDLYRIEDDVFRMAAYMRHKSTGLSPEDAAAAAREEFIDYDIRAPWVNAARNSVLPFISYTYRATPLVARMIATRPWKLAKYALLAYLANALAYMLAPGNEDDERRSMDPREQGRTWIGMPRMMRMPWRDRYGNPVFLDIRRWIPAADIFDVANSNGSFPMPAPLNFGGPLQLGAELLLNKSAFTGDPITNDLTDTWMQKGGKIADYVYKAWMPSAAWVPGSWYWSKIADAIGGVTDFKGRPLQLEYVIPSSFGVKLKPQDIESGFYFQKADIRDAINAFGDKARQLKKDLARKRISKETFDAGMQDIKTSVQDLAKRAATLNPTRPPTGATAP